MLTLIKEGNITTLKKSRVEPDVRVPYLISDCRDRSSAFFMGASILLFVRKAARLAVYDDTIINVNRYQMLATHLVEDAFGAISLPVEAMLH